MSLPLSLPSCPSKFCCHHSGLAVEGFTLPPVETHRIKIATGSQRKERIKPLNNLPPINKKISDCALILPKTLTHWQNVIVCCTCPASSKLIRIHPIGRLQGPDDKTICTRAPILTTLGLR